MNESTRQTMFSSATNEWATPQEFLVQIHPKDTLVACLIPARTDTKYWHDYCMKANKIMFVKGRLKFGDGTGSAPFPSAVVIFDGGEYNHTTPKMEAIDRQ